MASELNPNGGGAESRLNHNVDLLESSMEAKPGMLMSTSMMVPSTTPEKSLLTNSSNDISQKGGSRGGSSTYLRRSQTSASNKDREERLRKIKELQEDERRKKLEELKQHAVAAQKFREHQEEERRKHMEQMRYREMDKLSQVSERRRAIELADRERKEAMLKKGYEREEKILEKRRAQQGQSSFAFGSSTPRTLHPAVGSTADVWGGGRRYTSTSNVNAQSMSQSMYNGRPEDRDSDNSKSKRATSVTGLDKNEGLSRENSCHTPSRPPSALSTGASGVRMRPATARKSRPISIATTGVMSQSMIEKRPNHSRTNQKLPNEERNKRSRSRSTDRIEDPKSSSGNISPAKTPTRKTPAQVKADSNAKKINKAPRAAPENPEPPIKSPVAKKYIAPSSSDETEIAAPGNATSEVKRAVMPDIIAGEAKYPIKTSSPPPSEAAALEVVQKQDTEETADDPSTPAKKIISNEDEAKMRLAEKRKEMKEKKEREAELERQRQAELAREEEERIQREEEEERKAIEEAEKLAEEGRRIEEERLQKAMEEARKREAEEDMRKEEEDRMKREKEEADLQARKEAAKKQVELEEKLRKEEEERLARKKRIEEIMARTRGAKGTDSTNTTPKKEPLSTSVNDSVNGDLTISFDKTVENNNHSTADSAVASSSGDSAKPDLLVDVRREQESMIDVRAENEKNSRVDLGSPVEKGFLDTKIKESPISEESNSKSNGGGEPSSNGQASLNLSEFDGLHAKKLNSGTAPAESAAVELDQILDLSEVAETNNSSGTAAAPPFIAFQENPASNQEHLLGDLLS